MASKKPKPVKNVTEIENASVKIEVEEKDDDKKVEEVGEESALEPVQTEDTEETQEESQEVTTETDESDSSGGTSWRKIFLIILVVVPVGLLIFGGILYFTNNLNLGFLNKESKKTIELPQITPTPAVAEVDKEAYEIEVQNGSGISGEAAKVKDLLEGEGFKVGAIGNADNSNYTETIITVNDEVPQEYIDELTKVLEKRGPVGEVKKFAIGEGGEVLVIVGSELTSSPTPGE